jgi:hypothetical protein
MKKLVCLLAVLALAGAASAASVAVVTDGVFQGVWNGGTNDQGFGGGTWTTGAAAPGGGTAIEYDGTAGWVIMPVTLVGGTATTDITGNRYLEYLVYYDNSVRPGVYAECFNANMNGAERQFQAQANATYTEMSNLLNVLADVPLDYMEGGVQTNPPIMVGGEWMHVKLDLLNNAWGAMGAPLEITGVGAIRYATHNHTGGLGWNPSAHVYISDMVFSETGDTLIPEPATIALLGFGGLALIRRKR